ncbi:MAG: hypothetical protein Q9177_005459, partial [Variospora cf. flavescens]
YYLFLNDLVFLDGDGLSVHRYHHLLKMTIPLTSASAKKLLQIPKKSEVLFQKIQGGSCQLSPHPPLAVEQDPQPVASIHVQLDLPIEEDGTVEIYLASAKAVRKYLRRYGI